MQDERNKPGRPRDRAVAEAIRTAALHLVRKRGYRNVTIAAIAQDAGVARQTLYNRWPTKADIILDAVFQDTGHHAEQPSLTADKSCAAHLEQFLTTVFDHLSADGGTMRALIAAAQDDDAFREAFRERFVAPREEMVVGLLVEAKNRGELPLDADTETLSSMIHGAFWYRLLTGQDLDHHFARRVTQSIFARDTSAAPPGSTPVG